MFEELLQFFADLKEQEIKEEKEKEDLFKELQDRIDKVKEKEVEVTIKMNAEDLMKFHDYLSILRSTLVNIWGINDQFKALDHDTDVIADVQNELLEVLEDEGLPNTEEILKGQLLKKLLS